VTLPTSARFRAGLCPLLLLLAPGCDSQDKSPSGPGGGGTDLQTAQQQAVLAFDTANGLLTGVDEIAHGDFSGITIGLPTSTARAETFQWDSVQGAWVLSDAGTETDSTGTATWSVAAWIQFRDGAGQPQMEPGPTTAALTIDLDWDIYAEATQDGETYLLDLTYADRLEVSGLPDGPYQVDGQGSLSGRLAWTGTGQESFDVSFAMGWDVDLVVPDANGCPTGTMTVSFDQYQATATYAGTPSYSWVMRENGAVVATGSEPLACDGVPAGTTPVRVWDRWSTLRP